MQTLIRNKMKITKKEALAIHDGSLTIKELYPKLFKTKFTGWAKDDTLPERMVYFKNDEAKYGFDYEGDWLRDGHPMIKSEDSYSIDSDNRPATDKEVEEALTKEAIKRGLVEGATRRLRQTAELKEGDYFLDEEGCFRYGIRGAYAPILLRDDKWAEIIPQETITKKEAEKRLGLKIK